MKLHQLSLFLENRPGHLIAPCKALAEAGINILTLSVADTQRFGILRFVVRDWEKAKAVLTERGHVVNVTEVVVVEVSDRPGGLVEILETIGAAGVNVEYMYAFTFKRGERGALLFRFDDADRGIAALKAKGIGVLGCEELYRLLDAN
jgi:hypothetical protein